MTYPGGYASLDVLTAANMNLLPGGSKGQGYAQITSGTAAVGTTVTDISGLSITFTAVSGRRYRITGQALISKASGSAGDTINLYIRDGSGTQIALNQQTASGTYPYTLTVGVTTAPSAGSTTYKLSFNNSAGTSAVSASSTNPAWILVEDIGPS